MSASAVTKAALHDANLWEGSSYIVDLLLISPIDIDMGINWLHNLRMRHKNFLYLIIHQRIHQRAIDWKEKYQFAKRSEVETILVNSGI